MDSDSLFERWSQKAGVGELVEWEKEEGKTIKWCMDALYRPLQVLGTRWNRLISPCPFPPGRAINSEFTVHLATKEF